MIFLLKKYEILIRFFYLQIMIKKIQSIDSIEAYTYGTSKDLVSKKEEIKCNNIKKQYKND